jgi:hypothetical protein
MLSSSPSVSSKWNGPAAKIEQAGNALFHHVKDLKHRLNFQSVKLFKCQCWIKLTHEKPPNPVFPVPVMP